MEINRARILLIIGGLFIIASLAYPFYGEPRLLYLDDIIGNYVFVILLIGFLCMISPMILEISFIKKSGNIGNFLLYFTFSVILATFAVRVFSPVPIYSIFSILKSGFFVYIIGVLLVFLSSLLLLRD
jgi:uncharacterized membrane protein